MCLLGGDFSDAAPPATPDESGGPVVAMCWLGGGYSDADPPATPDESGGPALVVGLVDVGSNVLEP